MRYTNGNFEAFARPKNYGTAEGKHAYIVGTGLAGLAAAVFLIRDGYMPGENIHLFEELPVGGGSMDGKLAPHDGFVTRGGREMENHFETLWDLFRSIPSLEHEGASVLDEFYWLNDEDPNSSNCRMIQRQGERVPDDGDFTLTPKAQRELVKLFMTREEDLVGLSIEDFFSEEFFESNFWLYWCTMFAFERWHSAIEMRRYVLRFVHHIQGLPDFTALKFTRYNQYESLIKPLLAYLNEHNVTVHYGASVTDIQVEHAGDQKIAKELTYVDDDGTHTLNLTSNDLVFVTNGSITESSTQGNQNTPAPVTDAPGPSWELWEKLAAQDPAFGHPATFYKDLPRDSWFVSATVTWLNDKIDPYIERITKRPLRTGKIVSGGIITVKDSNWGMSFAIHRQAHFKEQALEQTITWVYALHSATPGNYIKKPIEECTGAEIAQELLYHLGVPEYRIKEMAEKDANTVPVYMPFITSYFMMRKPGDRPEVVPAGSQNLAFIGNFAETERDTVFTTEYSVRTAMEAVYQFLDIKRGVPEVWASSFDIRELTKAMYYLSDRKTLDEMEMPRVQRRAVKWGLKKIKNTYVADILRNAGLIKRE